MLKANDYSLLFVRDAKNGYKVCRVLSVGYNGYNIEVGPGQFEFRNLYDLREV